MATALYEFMPYGAPELIDGASRRLFRATTSGALLWVVIFAAVLAVSLSRTTTREVERTIVVPYRELAAPPPLTQAEPPPQIAQVTTSVPPTAGVPVPVPEAQAPPEQTIASQQEIGATTGSVEEGNGQSILVVEPPPSEELPKLGDYVYADELPVLITDVAPEYPEIARQAETEGDVLLRVLVGKDGRIADVHVDQSNPMFDQAAIDAARKWVFKPAISNNRPVAVWIARRVRFSLTASPS